MKYTMSIAEAARVLGKTERTIRNYIKTAQLTSARRGRSRFLDPEEVQELLVEEDSSRVTAAEMRALRATVRRLEAHINVIQQMLDLKNEPLGMTDEYARSLLSAALEQYGRPHGSYTIKELEAWASIFARMDESDLQTLCAATSATSWKTLLRLSSRMVSEVASREDYKTSLDAQQVHRLLADGRRRLKISIFIYLEMTSQIFSEIEETEVKTSLFESLKKQVKPS